MKRSRRTRTVASQTPSRARAQKTRRAPREKGRPPSAAQFRRLVKRLAACKAELLARREALRRSKAQLAEAKKSEARFHAFMDNSPGIAWIQDHKGRYVFASKTFERRFRLARNVWCGKTVFELWPRKIARLFLKNDRAVLRYGRARQFIEEARNPDGTPGFWMITRFLMRDATGRKFVAGMGFDVTQLKMAEEFLRESEARYRTIVETTNEGIWRLDALGHTEYVNPQMATMLGYGEREMLGRHFLEFMDEEARREAKRLFRQRRQGIAIQHDFRFRCKDGHDVWTIVTTNPLFDSSGRFSGALAMMTDITDRKRTEQELLDSGRRLQALMEAVPVGVSFSHDTTCQHITGNPAFLAQFEITARDNISASASDPSAVGRRMRYYRGGRELAASELPLQQAVKHNRVISPIELEAVWPSGRRRILEVSGAPVRDSGGRVIGGIAVTADITRRKRMEEELKQLNTRLEERVAARTEELRHLAERLASIQDEEQRRVAGELHDTIAQLLVATSFRLADLRPFAEGHARIEATLRDLEHFVAEAQNATRNLTFELDPVSLARAGLDAALRELCVNMSARHKIRYAFGASGEPSRPPKNTAVILYKAVRELMFNVAKHAGVNTAAVRAIWGPAGCRITVEDRGKGFDPVAPRGHGLVGITERMRGIGGRVDIVSVPGKSTRVSLTLPYRQTAAMARNNNKAHGAHEK